MNRSYIMNDDDDSEEEELEQETTDEKNIEKHNSSSVLLTWRPSDIEKLKQQTSELVDLKWKETRMRHLLQKMLELESPMVTAKMVDFLVQDDVCEEIVRFITQVVPADQPKPTRPSATDPQTNAMKLAYRAVILISPENPSEALNTFLSKRARSIARSVFDIFSDRSMGSFYHVYRIIECLLRSFPNEVYSGFMASENKSQTIAQMVAYIGFPPVSELLVMLIAFSPVARASPLYATTTANRTAFVGLLISANFFMKLGAAIVDPLSCCCCDAHVEPGQHSSVATQFLQEIIEKLSMEDTEADLLRSLVYDDSVTDTATDPESAGRSGLLDVLLDTLTCKDLSPQREAVDTDTGSSGCRRAAAKIISFLLRKAAEPEVVSYIANGPTPSPIYISNRLYPYREQIVNIIRERLADLTDSLINYEKVLALTSRGPSSCGGAVKYSSYQVANPFTTVRSHIIEVVVLLAESDEIVAGMLPLDLWKLFMSWIIVYAHNNIYHALLYRLVFAVLRQGQEGPQRLLFQKVKFASFLVENFVPFVTDEEAAASYSGASSSSSSADRSSPEYNLKVNRIASRGFIMNCANAIRLQVSCLPPSSFLPNFISSHQKWQSFLPALSLATDIQLRFGMGIKVSAVDSGVRGGGERGGLAVLISEPVPEDSRFAKALGFFDEEGLTLRHVPSEASSLPAEHEYEDEPACSAEGKSRVSAEDRTGDRIGDSAVGSGGSGGTVDAESTFAEAIAEAVSAEAGDEEFAVEDGS